MKFSTAKVAITPAGPTHLGGYGARKLKSIGTYSDIYSRAILLSDGESGILFISLELTGADRIFISRVKKRIAEISGLGEKDIFIHTVHTHSAPAAYIYRRFPYTSDDDYLDFLEEKIVECTKECLATSQEGQMEIGKGETYIGMNRRQKTDGGIVLAPNPDGPADRDLFVITIKDMEDNVKAVLYSCACHPTVLDHDNLYVTGDFVSPACTEIEKRYEGAMAMFIQGACGDINPATKAGNTKHRQTYFSDIEFTGKVLANDVYNTIRCGMEKVDVSIRVKVEDIILPFGEFKTKEFKERMEKANIPAITDYCTGMIKRIESGYFGKGANFLVGMIEFSPRVRMVTLEGEICQGIGVDIKNLYEDGYTIIAGYSNGVIGYVPTVEILREGGYEATAPYMGYGLPGPFAENAEDVILECVKNLK